MNTAYKYILVAVYKIIAILSFVLGLAVIA